MGQLSLVDFIVQTSTSLGILSPKEQTTSLCARVKKVSSHILTRHVRAYLLIYFPLSSLFSERYATPRRVSFLSLRQAVTTSRSFSYALSPDALPRLIAEPYEAVVISLISRLIEYTPVFVL